uniref:Uncharacterized protein n=1 Tax=Arundo donax TaxID=35708 RepID=A0A0A9DDB4_ARUDO
MCPSCERVASNPATSTSAPASSAPPATTTTTTKAPASREHRPSSFAALFAATRTFPLVSSQPRPPAPASNCL